ncbi:hypothetical protein [Herbaspirillum sp. SJZ099]|uniref:hypothetical protein n=1 Tax=Herbaspirillum sp. SJZ099 TaxID=2572916 RepID=UPI00119F97D7|nr:hypothetical protein [Herbaspirillum sp. SJZ099]TWC65147.1 hypothetical protein FB597_10790 [Herbaspirillum sp. SJZ099]
MRSSPLAQRACALLAFSLSILPALAQDDVNKALTPYASDVRKALAPLPGESTRPGLDINDSESAACRGLRLQIERARSAPAPQYDVYPEAPLRDGRRDANAPIPGGATTSTSRSTFLKPGGNDHGQLGQLETRYINECR